MAEITIVLSDSNKVPGEVDCNFNFVPPIGSKEQKEAGDTPAQKAFVCMFEALKRWSKDQRFLDVEDF